jgi:hypothetical protein
MRLTGFTVAIASIALVGCSDRSAKTIGMSVVDTCPGGAVRPVCMSQQDKCVTQFPDAGKTCSTSSQCKGKCMVDLTAYCDSQGKCSAREPPETGARVLGTCQVDDNPCGSFIFVEGGVAQAPVHSD